MRYQIDKNDAGITSVLFRFDNSGDCFITFITENAIHNIPFGLDKWLYGITDRTLSFSRSVYSNTMGITPVNTAGICTWKDKDQLSAYYLSMFNAGASENFLFTFDGDRLRMEIKAPEMPPRPGLPGMQQQAPENIILNGTKITN